jgi:(1->4)-alpha-D-glucan 1-alpha-D-glucosylmutase
MRWQQFTGPIMAKGMEDSALYAYNPLVSLNEVGGAPDSDEVSIDALHQFCRNRQPHGHTLTATSTHDTKRAEDVRTRINVLSEFPERWRKTLALWTKTNRVLKEIVEGQEVPDPNEEILLYQTMLGAWPLENDKIPEFRKRLEAYMLKAAREARVHTDWIRPNHVHERALRRFVKVATRQSDDNAFLPDFLRLFNEVAYYGAITSLGLVLLKITIPGVPDFYQGSELWDFRLVDPDNRGPVDFEKRARLLAGLKQREQQIGRLELTQDLLNHWQDGRIKLFVTSRALNFRREHESLFLEGAYHPLRALGPGKENVFAFMRQKGNAWTLVAVPRLVTELSAVGRPPTGERAWADSTLVLPRGAPDEWGNVLTGESLKACTVQRGRSLRLADAFSKFPVGLLTAGG